MERIIANKSCQIILYRAPYIILGFSTNIFTFKVNQPMVHVKSCQGKISLSGSISAYFFGKWMSNHTARESRIIDNNFAERQKVFIVFCEACNS